MEKFSVSFECRSYGNRSGFVHECTATTTDDRVVKTKIQYYNRTWEAHQFDSVKHKAVDILIESETDAICNEYKKTNNCKRLPKGFRTETQNKIRAKYKEALAGKLSFYL